MANPSATLFVSFLILAVSEMYDLWLARHGKAYNGIGDRERRFEICKDNLRFVDEHNAVENRTYKRGLNKFADMTNEEYRARFLGTRSDPKSRVMKAMRASDRYAARSDDMLPSRVDWRTRGTVNPVKDQGSCVLLCCWSESQAQLSREPRMEFQFLDVLTKKFTWKIPSFSKIVEDKHYSQTFSIHGGNWRILMYPKGNQTDHLSLYLDVPEATTISQGWEQTACFSFILVNQLIGDNSKILEGGQTGYIAESIYWGFNEFMPLSELQDPSNGFLVNDTLIVEVKFETKLTGDYVVTPTKFSWKIANFPSLTEKYYYSPAFKIGHGNWKLLLFPIRDESQQTHLWLYLEVANQATLPEGWNINAKFNLVIVNQNDNSKSIIEDIQNEFKWGEMRRGFPSTAELHDGNEGFIVNNTLIVEADFVPDEVEPTGEQLLALRSFTWKITNFTELNAEKYYSQIFTIDGNHWRIVMYPKGKETNNLSLFLNVPDSTRLPQGWKRSAHFSLIVVNQNQGGNDYLRGGEGTPVEFNGIKIQRGYRDFLPQGRLHEPSNGYLVNDNLIVKVKFESELLEEHTVTSKKFTWKIKNFPSLTAKYYTSPTFEIDGIKWRLQIFPHGNGNDRSHLSLYLHVMNFEALPEGWTIDATYKLLIVNQDNHLRSSITEEKNEFCAGIVSWGEQSMISSSELLDGTTGFIVNNSLIVQADFILLKIEPTTAPFLFHFSRMEKFISEAEDLASMIGSSSYNRNELVPYATTSSDDIVKAKQSLKECLSDLFKLNMKERLAEALLILSRAESGLTADQKRSITTFREGFDEFTSDFLAFELANSKFELLKIQKDRVLSDLKRTQETHRSIETKTDELAKREEIIQTRLQEIESEKERLKSEWEVLVVESQEAKCKYEIQEKKVAAVMEKKRFSEQRMSRSTAAWANMKAQFA